MINNYIDGISDLLARECTLLNGFNVAPVSISPNGLTAVYKASSPFPSLSKRIDFFRIQATCTSNGPTSAPTCNWTVSLRFCNKGGTCNSSDRTYRRGRFFASGTGPAAYTITGGTRSFNSATGSIDSELDLASFNLNNVSIYICYPKPIF